MAGNEIDALMYSQAVISQYVLIEIKKPSSTLLRSKRYRSGCWTVSQDLVDAIGQVQKSTFDFVSNQNFKVQLKDEAGQTVGKEVYRIQPKSYLVIGNLSELKQNDEKFICFQIFRNSVSSPEIITYDELFNGLNVLYKLLACKNQKNKNGP